jgi:putative transposase
MLPQNFNIHRPLHLYFDESIYFITARTIGREKFWNKNNKPLFVSCLNELIKKFKISLYSWVLLDNHYHFLLKIKDKNDLSRLINFINGKSAFELNRIESKRCRKIWHQYWDYCIRDEKDFWMHFNYIHNNPIKHEFISNFDELKHYRFSSFNSWIKKKNFDWLWQCFENYPIRDFSIEGD